MSLLNLPYKPVPPLPKSKLYRISTPFVFLIMCCLQLTARQQTGAPDSIRLALQNTGNTTARVDLLNLMAQSYVQTNIDSILPYAEAAASLGTQLNYAAGVAQALKNTAIYHRNKGDYPTALKILLQVTHLYDSLDAKAPLGNVYCNIAQVYKDMAGQNRAADYLEKGIDYSKQAYNVYKDIRDTAGMVNSLNMAGIMYRDKGVMKQPNYYDTAFVTFTTALALIDQSGQGEEYRGKLYNNISQVYIEHRKDYKTALDYLFKAVAFNKSRNNFTSLSYNYNNISEAWLKLNNPEKSLAYAKKMLAVALQINVGTRIHDAYYQLHRSYREARQPDSALHYYKLADYIDDSLTNLAKAKQVMDLQEKYESRQKEQAIVGLQTESSNKTKQITLLIISLALLVTLAVCMIWLYSRVRKQRRQIQAQATRLEVMMKELHHRVKNNLQIVSSLLSLQTYKTQDEQAVSVLKESQQRVQAMSFIHQRLYKKDDLTAVNMHEYLTDLAESLVASYGYDRDSFDLQIQVEKEMLDIDKALPIGLIINEMMTNALKYAYADVNRPSLQISLTEHDGALTIVVKDNGRGLNETEWNGKNNSFGKQLIKALCKQLRAQQSLDVSGGTQFTITIQKVAA